MNLKQIEEEFDKKFIQNWKGGMQSVAPITIIPEIEQFISTKITQILEELREEEWTTKNAPISKMEYEIMGLEYIQGKVQEHNRIVEILNDKINKILNK